jgi:Mg-chelatase subunit ChlD
MSSFNHNETLSMEQDLTFPYNPDCMSCHSIIAHANISFHNSETEIPIQIFEDAELKFGTLEIKIRPEIPINSNHIHLLFTIDTSCSMRECCIDGESKMSHIKHTLKNMLRIFYENEQCNISVHVQSFDTEVKTIISGVTNIRDSKLSELLSSVSNLTPDGLTDIGLALSSAVEHITNYKEKNLNHELVHIFLTDGDITKGILAYDELLSLVPKKCNNIFIGYGNAHDYYLLSHLAKTKGNEYRFIDALEKAGLVYGEVIHGILYNAIEDVTLSVNDGEIYNFLTNSWDSEIEIGNLLSDQKKTFHIRSKTPDTCVVKINGKTIIKTRQFQTVNIYENQLVVSTSSNKELSIYIFRQRTQELLYECRKVSEKYKRSNNLRYFRGIKYYTGSTSICPEKMIIKEKLSDFQKIMRDFMKKHNLELDPIMKMLCDDIYIVYKTIDTYIGSMYTCARQTSNGREQTYMCTSLTSDDDNSYNLYNSRIVYNTVLQEQPNNHTVILSNQTQEFDYSNEEIFNIDTYIPTQDFLSPFTSDGILTLMSEVSGNYSICHNTVEYDDVTR